MSNRKTHSNSRLSYHTIPPESVLEVAREILRQQRAGLNPTANTVGRVIGKPASSVTGRVGDIRNPKKGNGRVMVDDTLYQITELDSVIDRFTGKPNAVLYLVDVSLIEKVVADAAVKPASNAQQIEIPYEMPGM